MASLTPAPPSAKIVPSTPSPTSSGRPVESAKSKEDDSGIVDLAMASQADPQASVRAQTTPLAQDGLFDDEPASIRPPASAPLSAPMSAPLSLQQPAPSVPPFGPASVPPSIAPVSQQPAPMSGAAASSSRGLAAQPAKKGNGAVIALVVGGLVALSAAAAGGFFFLKNRAESAARELQGAATIALNDPAPAAADTKPAEATPAEATPAEPTPAPEANLDPNALPTATPNGKLAAAPKAGTPAAKGAPVAAAPAKAEGPKISEKDLPTAPAVPEGDLSKAMGKAVGADGKPVEATPAAGTNGPQFAAGTVPQKPSQGAVTGALGAVLPGARACLGPDDPISRASITFGSAGNVQSVSVSGGAAGKPAEACIKGALMKAKLTPFAEPTYTANITVRHN
ncbi:MAG: hypothetical protein KF819_11160 [Labilithrix sp.]|nr:hypothetical protein [Labilithrix sp.]